MCHFLVDVWLNFGLNGETLETEVVPRILEENFWALPMVILGGPGPLLVDVWLDFGKLSSVLAQFGPTLASP